MRAAAFSVRVLMATAGVLWLAVAQAQPVPREEAPPATQCLTATDPKLQQPDYPFAAFKRQTPGRVKVTLVFTRPDSTPVVQVLSSEGGDEFVDAVKDYARTLRVPCMKADDVAQALNIEYVFKPDDRKVNFGPMQLPDADRRAELMRCVNWTEVDLKAPYPRAAQQAEIQGRVLAELRFETPDTPPVITLHHRPSATVLARDLPARFRNLRMACFQPGVDKPITAIVPYTFVFRGESYGFAPMTLLQLLGSVRGIRQQTVKFDTRTMGCPFDVRLHYRRPGLANTVGSVGDYMPEREPLLAWLRQAELDLPRQSLDMVYGDTAQLTVPCVDIDLRPQ